MSNSGWCMACGLFVETRIENKCNECRSAELRAAAEDGPTDECNDCGSDGCGEGLCMVATGYQGLGEGERWLCAECAGRHMPMNMREIRRLISDLRSAGLDSCNGFTVGVDGMAGSVCWSRGEDEPTVYCTPDWESSEPTLAISVEGDGQYFDGDTLDWPDEVRSAETYFAIVKPWLDKQGSDGKVNLPLPQGVEQQGASQLQLIPVVRDSGLSADDLLALNAAAPNAVMNARGGVLVEVL